MYRLLDASVYKPKNFGALKTMGASLRHRNFALYFYGMCVVLVGMWIGQVAMGWLVFRLTNSLAMLSTTVFLSQIPTLFIAPLAGVLSDRFDRRKIMIVTQTLMMLQSLALGVLVLLNKIDFQTICAFSLFFGCVVGVDAPARQALYAKLVPLQDLPNAIALNSAAMNGSRFVGPAIGGFLIGAFGEAWCFIIGGLAFGAIILSLALIKMPPKIPLKKSAGALAELRDGFAYLCGSMPLRTILLTLTVICFFGLPFPTLLPAFAGGTLAGDSTTLGNMMSLIGLGAFVAAMYLTARKSALGLGRVITISGTLFGLGLIAISQAGSASIAYIFCAPIGFGMIALAASSNVMIQSLVEESKRGRMMSFFSMAFFGIPPLGTIAQGYLANFIDWRILIMLSGIVCILATFVFEIFRPKIRLLAREIYAEKNSVSPEFAEGIRRSET